MRYSSDTVEWDWNKIVGYTFKFIQAKYLTQFINSFNTEIHTKNCVIRLIESLVSSLRNNIRKLKTDFNIDITECEALLKNQNKLPTNETLLVFLSLTF